MNRAAAALLLLRLCRGRVAVWDRASAPGHLLSPAERQGLATAQREIDDLWAARAARVPGESDGYRDIERG